ncbi:NDMA-dependent alcohol dehydrogenase [Phytoactinopolyspora halotolerans]|uniref:NDMA-dependent alcohol dehydrogenase n=1 Tax=Phytoactinopolyspora halotolerans TaxID=1981512 RepID=A0A6L9SJB7_9ACTN|nr:NDMA-dependent alcohol dehydrogenase [Phytoactinopolyspora halotolerans]NEE04788.1 NDMA-dependent alcohol dehydrogenase [Phytoactinopolyspora halotolerans]
MQTQAAVLWEYGGDWQTEELELDDPRAGEVLVRLTASGLCHSDEHVRVGDLPMEGLPTIGGHEGAGVVEQVGPDVTSVHEGDHVVLSFIPACGRCWCCAGGHQNLCDEGAELTVGLQRDGSSRHHVRGEDARLMCLLGTFAPYTVVRETSVVKIREDVPLDKAALVGCGVTTGWGTAVYGARVSAGDTVAVLGIGGVGANAVQGARIAGASQILAIDPSEFNRAQAKTFGATHTFASAAEAREALPDLTLGRMADAALVTVGVASGSIIGEALSLVGKLGTVALTSLAPVSDDQVTMPMFELAAYQKRVVGCLFGDANPRYDIPRLLELYLRGELLLDELVTRTYAFSDINQGYEDMRTHRNIRGMIRFD